MKLLLMEDEPHLRQSIKQYLQIKGHDVDDFINGEELLNHANPHDYDCMILDVNTPEIDGFEVLRYIRENDISTPAIYISALTDLKKVLEGFEIGAQDYLKKPFDLAELEVRLARFAPMETKHFKLDTQYCYDINNRLLFKDAQECKLSITQKKLLYLLIKNKNTLVTFDQILDYVWDGKQISHSTILSTVRDLKKLLPANLIKNVKGEGYRISLT